MQSLFHACMYSLAILIYLDDVIRTNCDKTPVISDNSKIQITLCGTMPSVILSNFECTQLWYLIVFEVNYFPFWSILKYSSSGHRHVCFQ